MRRFRIIKLMHDSGSKGEEFVIERKKMFGWSEIMRVELKHKRLSFETYEEAEKYLKDNYCGHGLLTQSANVYYFEPYSYFL
jgi:hypothetical protein